MYSTAKSQMDLINVQLVIQAIIYSIQPLAPLVHRTPLNVQLVPILLSSVQLVIQDIIWLIQLHVSYAL